MPLSDEERKARAAAYMRKYYAEHPEYREKVKATTNRWRKLNPEARREQARVEGARRYARNPEKYRQYAREYRALLSSEERRELHRQAWEYQQRNINRYLLYNARYRAKECGIPFDLKPEDIVIPAACPVLGIPMSPAFNKRGPNGKRNGGSPGSPSLDRIVPELGYVRGNVMVISHRANSLKRDSTDPAEHRAIADYIERETARVRRELG